MCRNGDGGGLFPSAKATFWGKFVLHEFEKSEKDARRRRKSAVVKLQLRVKKSDIALNPWSSF